MTDASGQRAELSEIARKLVLRINEITPAQWDGRDQRARAIILAALQATRQEALREAAERLGAGDFNGLLAAPCLWCGYNGEGYYQAGTHGQSCPWNTIGGCDERLDRLAREGVK